MNQAPSNFEFFPQEKLTALNSLLVLKIDDVFDQLGVRLQGSGRLRIGPCPVHAGDSPSALNFYTEGDYVPGYWRCNTRRCQVTHKPTPLGFVRGVLSREEQGWAKPGDRVVSFRRAVERSCEMVGCKLEELGAGSDDLVEKQRFAASLRTFRRMPTPQKGLVSREQLRAKLGPPTYLLGRGFSPEVLDKYDVGTCLDPAKPLFGRVVVPVYADDGRAVVGLTCRSVHPPCRMCKRYHDPHKGCPRTEADVKRSSKWYNHGLKKESVLFNFWKVRKAIAEQGVVVLDESLLSILRLEEAGIHCGLAMFGTTLSDEQQVILETSGASTVVFCRHRDAAGEESAECVRRKLGRLFRLEWVDLPAKDIAEVSAAGVASLLNPILDKYRRKQ